MARDGVAVRPEVAAAVATFARDEGASMNVRAECQRLGIGTSWFYELVQRFNQEGIEGLFPRTRRPHTSPTQLPEPLVEVLVRLHKELAEDGWDASGPAILTALKTRHRDLWPAGTPLPSTSTINRKLRDRGLTATVPQRRPKRATRRFERTRANELWQLDGFQVKLVDSSAVVVMHVTDDCSRVDLVLQAVPSENTHDTWTAFSLAVERYGLPAELVSDNGIAFSGKRRGWQSVFERNLSELGVRYFTSSIAHPQTCGKNERAHQRVRKWLARRPRATDLESLQALLDEYRDGFNNRPNRVLDELTPHERHALGPVATAASAGVSTRVSRHGIGADGKVSVDRYVIGVGRAYKGQHAVVFATGDRYLVFVGDVVAADLVIDKTRKYQRKSR